MIKFIVKFAPEITIKSKPVRQRFATRLAANIEKVCRYHALEGVDLVKRWDMLEIRLDQQHGESAADFEQRGGQLSSILRDIPGIAHFMEVAEFSIDVACEQDDAAEQALRLIAGKVAQVHGDSLQGKSFAVRCKRSGEHPFTSHDVEQFVGAHFLRENLAGRVNLTNPEIKVALEIKRERLFVVKQRQEGLGGYPLGAVSPVLSLISGGYDSSVASFETMRRGMETHFLFFNLGGHAHEVGVKQVAHYLWGRYGSSHRTAFVNVPFEEVIGEILLKIDNPYMGVVLKRMMMRAASEIANSMNIPALVTGESVAQVSSQTLPNLKLIDKVSSVLTLRPLVTSDKTDIMARAATIGVAPFAEHMPEYCAVISDRPTTAARPERLEELEGKFDFDILDRAIGQRKTCAIDSVYEAEVLFDAIEQISIPEPGQVIIDLRSGDQREKQPLVLHANENIHIPFYKINQLFAGLDANREYLLYCDRGVMSRLHAAHLIADGHKNIKIYQPAV